MASIVSSLDASDRLFAEKMDAICSYMQKRNFPMKLLRHVRRYFRHYYGVRTAVNEREILGQLSSTLRVEVADFLISDVVGKNEMFAALDRDRWAVLLTILKPCQFQRGHIVCERGNMAREMFILTKGVIELSSTKWLAFLKQAQTSTDEDDSLSKLLRPTSPKTSPDESKVQLDDELQSTTRSQQMNRNM